MNEQAMCLVKLPAILLCLVCFLPTTGDGELTVQGKAETNLGSFPSKDRKCVTFRLHNDGKTVERIRGVSQTCSCLQTTVSTNTVMPGCDVEVKVETVPEKLNGAFCYPIYVVKETGAQPNRFIRLTIRGEAVRSDEE